MIFMVTVNVPELPVVSEMQSVFSYFGLIYPSNRFAFGHQGTYPPRPPPPRYLKNKQSFFSAKLLDWA
jgi:hypothetical protein